MKIFSLSIMAAVPVAALTIAGIIPAVIGVGALLLTVMIENVILMWLVRGAPEEFMKARVSGGMVLGIVKRTRNLIFKRFFPQAGMIVTEKHGAFTVMPEGLYSVDGIMCGIAPENVGYNVRVDDAQLVEELKKRGISDIRDVCDLDAYGFVKGFKDDPRIKDLAVTPQARTTSFDDFYKYITEASNPIHQDANVKLGIAQGLLGREAKRAFLFIAAGLAVFFVLVGVAVLFQMGGGGGERTIHIVLENLRDNARYVIPA